MEGEAQRSTAIDGNCPALLTHAIAPIRKQGPPEKGEPQASRVWLNRPRCGFRRCRYPIEQWSTVPLSHHPLGLTLALMACVFMRERGGIEIACVQTGIPRQQLGIERDMTSDDHP